MTISAIALLLAAAAAPTSSVAPLPAGETLRFESPRMGGVREVVVGVPRGETGSPARYPVVYVLDGGEGFLPASAAAGFLSSHLSMPEVIVVAVKHADRGFELTPVPSTPGAVPGVAHPGGADRLLASLAEEVIPLVESRYPTQPYRVLVGHSLGGLFAVHALAARPDLFQGFVLLDPALWWDQGRVGQRLEAFFRGHPDARARLAVVASAGGSDDGPRDPSLPSVRFRRIVVEGESHETLAFRGIYEGLRALFSDYVPAYRHAEEAATMPALEAQYAALSRELGFPVAIPSAARTEVERRQKERASRSPAATVGTTSPPVSAAAAAPFVGTWEGVLHVEPGTPLLETLTFTYADGRLTGRCVAHGVAMDGGDFTLRLSVVRVTEAGLEWERENGGGGAYVSSARLTPRGTLEGTEDLRGGRPPPPGFVPPKVTFVLTRATSR